jgi:transcriptional regulator with XRE-family HTH domain
MIISGQQLRIARDLIGLSQLALAVTMQVGRKKVEDFEAGRISFPPELLSPLRRAFEAAGVEFGESGEVKKTTTLRN